MLSRLGRSAFLAGAIWLASDLTAARLHAQDSVPSAAPLPVVRGPVGRISGRVVDAESGRPIAQARISVVGVSGAVQSDLEGRYRTGPIPVGVRALRAVMIGYRQQEITGIDVTADQVAIVNLALTSSPVQIQELVVQAEVAPVPVSDAGLLALQKASPVASDGISAEAMSRSPDSDAGAAIARVTGVSVVDNKFVVVRGLEERYNSTLLNGSELPSPEPMKRTVPLDVFPASLLEAIVTAKTATPDMPGDFAGGSVQIMTKEFPENFVGQLWLSSSYNSEATFQPAVLGPSGSTDWLARDDGGRRPPAEAPTVADNTGDPAKVERFAEALRNVWTPAPTDAPPSLGGGFNLGGQIGASTANPVGVVASLSYNAETEQVNDRQFAFVSDTTNGTPDKQLTFDETHSIVDLGGIFNVATRLGLTNELAFKNFYTRNAEEVFFNSTGYDAESNLDQVQDYQVLYVERSLFQTQLSGSHLLASSADARVDWKATYASATRDEPDNRQARYGRIGTGPYSLSATRPNYSWFRYLDDQIFSGQLDWAQPVSIRAAGDGQLKIGALYRGRQRTFDAQSFIFTPLVSPSPSSYVTLPPEQAYAPENIGSNMNVQRLGGRSQPYESEDDVTAFYLMEDLPVTSAVRLAGGVRMEMWGVDLYPGSKAAPTEAVTSLDTQDWLWSANATVTLTPSSQLRLGAFSSVARPDPRELSADNYTPVGGECSLQGNPNLQPTNILNIDARYEIFPGSGEVLALSGFYKKFDQPILEVLDAPAFGGCRVSYTNAESATNIGGEFEARKSLGFIGSGLAGFTAGLNVLVVQSSVSLDSVIFGQAGQDLSLQGQSPYLFNVNLNYSSAPAQVTGSVLLNYFADRIVRYGIVNLTTSGAVKIPDAVEQGRLTLDAKVAKAFGTLTVTLSGKNLTNSISQVTQQTAVGDVPILQVGTGTEIKLGFGYDF